MKMFKAILIILLMMQYLASSEQVRVEKIRKYKDIEFSRMVDYLEEKFEMDRYMANDVLIQDKEIRELAYLAYINQDEGKAPGKVLMFTSPVYANIGVGMFLIGETFDIFTIGNSNNKYIATLPIGLMLSVIQLTAGLAIMQKESAYHVKLKAHLNTDDAEVGFLFKCSF